jgi:hypothetical protein
LPNRKERIMGTIHVEQRETVLIGTFDNPPHG